MRGVALPPGHGYPFPNFAVSGPLFACPAACVFLHSRREGRALYRDLHEREPSRDYARESDPLERGPINPGKAMQEGWIDSALHEMFLEDESDSLGPLP